MWSDILQQQQPRLPHLILVLNLFDRLLLLTEQLILFSGFILISFGEDGEFLFNFIDFSHIKEGNTNFGFVNFL